MQKILIADDDESIRIILSRILRAPGRELLVAEDGAEAVRLCRESLPDLVLLDAGMPVLNGLAACALLRRDAATRGIPIVILSGADVRGEADRDAPALFIQKPFDVARVASEVGRLLGAGAGLGDGPSARAANA